MAKGNESKTKKLMLLQKILFVITIIGFFGSFIPSYWVFILTAVFSIDGGMYFSEILEYILSLFAVNLLYLIPQGITLFIDKKFRSVFSADSKASNLSCKIKQMSKIFMIIWATAFAIAIAAILFFCI
ncbi:hypothetical protein [uncultured Eubacterium sp.]|uniref:hypothetical protein n=1 Tax=uncultured Eubacterium sp. TaxID=165185 RepID=UPI0025EE647F|nr:hypothetical protein [uncultured Eubacterium sp.]